MMKGLDVLGCPTVISTVNDPSMRAPRLAQVLAWARAGQLVPYVSHTFPLAEFAAAIRAKWRGEVSAAACSIRSRPGYVSADWNSANRVW